MAEIIRAHRINLKYQLKNIAFCTFLMIFFAISTEKCNFAARNIIEKCSF